MTPESHGPGVSSDPPVTAATDYEAVIRKAIHEALLDPDTTQGQALLSSRPFLHVAAHAVVEFVAAEVAAERERIAQELTAAGERCIAVNLGLEGEVYMSAARIARATP